MLTAADPRTIARYVVEDRLGRGGMGTVYLAQDPQLGRQVALKLVQAEFDSAEGRSRFEKEARSIAALNHPNIVTVYDLGEFESRPFIVLEYIEGYSIDAVIRERRPIPMDVRLRWLEELGHGLQFAHDRGIIHRDVKPANLMIDHLDRLRILDFGIARIAGTASTHLSSVIGTPGYMAPEYVLDQQLDQRVDIFAAGAVAYELLTYTPAFPGRTHATIIQKILECSPRRMSEASALVDAEVEAVIMRALQKDPAERYQSAEAFSAAVRDLRLQRDWSVSRSAVVSAHPPASPDDHLASDTPAAAHVVTPPAPDPTRPPSADTVVVPGDHAPFVDADRFVANQDVLIPTQLVARADTASSGPGAGDGAPSSARYALAAAAMVLVGAIAIGGTWLWSGADAAPPSARTTTPVVGSGVTNTSRTPSDPSPDSSPNPSPGPSIGPPAATSPSGSNSTVPPPKTSGVPGPAATAGVDRSRSSIAETATGAAATGPATRPAAMSASTLFFQPRTSATTETSGAVQSRAGLRYQIHQLMADNTETHVDPDTVFASGDRIRFAFETNTDGYLYVVQEGTSGKWQVLFPNPLINGGRNHVSAFTSHVIPTDRGFRFEGKPGLENIFVFFSTAPVAKLPGFDRPVTSFETIDRAAVDALEGQVRTRDLVIEEQPFTVGGNRDGTYVVNRDEFATAVAVSFTLQHK